MPAPLRVTNERIVEAYTRLGSVWKAGRELGVAGQSVWERLRALGHPMQKSEWTDEETAELRALAGVVTIGEIANRLGRPYAGVACKLSELQLSGASPRKRKVPRGIGLTKATMSKLLREAEGDPQSITQFCRIRRLNLDTFVLAAQKYEPDRWKAYVGARSPLPGKSCAYCEGRFVPTNARQQTCTRKCQRDLRADKNYFGGKRKNTVGLAEGVCQLCGKKPDKGLSSHHVLGKENDPGNDFLIALCTGCHNVVTLLGRTNYIITEAGWENLISIVALRRLADIGGDRVGVHVAVDLEWLGREDLPLVDADEHTTLNTNAPHDAAEGA